MLKSCWVIIIALGLGLATLGQAQNQAAPQGEVIQESTPSYEPPLPFPIEVVEDQATTEARKRSEEEARQREIADLAAQEGMNAATQEINTATKDMRDYALYSTIIVFIGTLLLIWTLVETRKASSAAHAGLLVMKNEQRPWLSLDFSLEATLNKFGNHYYSLSAESTINNHGATVATGLEFETYLRVHVLDGDSLNLGKSSQLNPTDTVFPRQSVRGPSEACDFEFRPPENPHRFELVACVRYRWPGLQDKEPPYQTEVVLDVRPVAGSLYIYPDTFNLDQPGVSNAGDADLLRVYLTNDSGHRGRVT